MRHFPLAAQYLTVGIVLDDDAFTGKAGGKMGAQPGQHLVFGGHGGGKHPAVLDKADKAGQQGGLPARRCMPRRRNAETDLS